MKSCELKILKKYFCTNKFLHLILNTNNPKKYFLKFTYLLNHAKIIIIFHKNGTYIMHYFTNTVKNDPLL